MALTKSERPFLPAAGHDWFLPIYDPLTRVLGFDAVRRALLDQAGLQPGHSVLDVGCGTGTLAVLIKRLHAGVNVIGVDPDARALARAERKAKRAKAAVRFDRGFGDALGYPNSRFDRVFSSMMFHHLSRDEQPRLLREIRRVLKPGGRLEFVDFAGADAHTHRGLGRLIHSHQRLQGDTPERIVGLMAAAGFAVAHMTRTQRTLFGRVAFFQGVAPRAG
jgi:ubiquinone/menaquinone biosynthesis C-methylase UbiE